MRHEVKPDRNIFVKVIFCFSILLTSVNTMAWGEDGHRVVGEIAWGYLRPEVRTRVGELLESAGEPNLAEATTWADRIRSDSRYDWAASMHYISLPRQWDGYKEERDCPPAGCILKAIDHFGKILGDRSATKSERAEALLFVAHFVGDLHQPLHTGLSEDRGGNDIKVEFFGFPTNLHALWDVYLPAGFVRDWKQYAEEQRRSIGERERKQWLDSTPEDWAAESQRLVHSHAYTSQVELGEDYYRRNREVVAQRLRRGGVRLAGLVNQVLGQQ